MLRTQHLHPALWASKVSVPRREDALTPSAILDATACRRGLRSSHIGYSKEFQVNQTNRLLPWYQSQIVPLAAILADIGNAWEHDRVISSSEVIKALQEEVEANIAR